MGPGILLAAAAVLGAVAGILGWMDRGSSWALALATGGIAIAVESARYRLGLAAAAVAAGMAGHAASERAYALSPSLALWFRTAEPSLVWLDATIRDDAEPARGGGATLTVDVARRWDGARWHPAEGRVRLHVSGALAGQARSGWSRGRRIRTPATLRWPAFIRNPGSPSLEWQALARGFVLAGTVKSATLIEVEAASIFEEWAASVRRYVRRASSAVFDGSPGAAAITTAIIIGDRAGLEPATEDRLLAAGTYHVLAISGGNIAVLTSLMFFGARLVFTSARLAPLVSLVLVALYGAVVIGEASVARAVTAALVWLSAQTLGLDARPLPILAAAAVAVLLLDPLAGIAPGAWLSVGATLGILTLAEPCARLLRGTASHRGWSVTSAALGAFAASIAVEIVLIPVGALVFSQVALGAPVFNLIAVPAMSVVQLAGSAAVGLWWMVPGAASIAATVAAWGSAAIVESPRLLLAAPWLAWRVPPPPWSWVAAFYATALAAVMPRTPARPRVVCGTAAVALVLLLPAGLHVSGRGPRPGWLRVSFLDVGQGDASVVTFPSGRSLLIDAGNRTETFDSGARVVVPALWAIGVRRLEWVLMSHADTDHAGGLPAVLPIFRPREVWEGIPVPGDPVRRDVRAAAEAVGASWRELRLGDKVSLDGVEVSALNPPVPDWERRRVRNDDSVVLRVSWGAFDLLLMGDTSEEVERSLAPLLTSERRRPIRVLKVGHHGSRTSTGSVLVEAFRPLAGVMSVGRNNPFGHPAREVVERLKRRGAVSFRTDRDGAVTVETDGRSAEVSTWNRPGTMRLVAPDAERP